MAPRRHLPRTLLAARLTRTMPCITHTRFRSRPHSVLVATDVAARGLDIKGVQHVIHYQLPRTVEVCNHEGGGEEVSVSYIHRCGWFAVACELAFSQVWGQGGWGSTDASWLIHEEEEIARIPDSVTCTSLRSSFEECLSFLLHPTSVCVCAAFACFFSTSTTSLPALASLHAVLFDRHSPTPLQSIRVCAVSRSSLTCFTHACAMPPHTALRAPERTHGESARGRRQCNAAGP